MPDYKDLVTRKVGTAKELYRFTVDQVQPEPRIFVELTVVVILVLELAYLFRRRPF